MGILAWLGVGSIAFFCLLQLAFYGVGFVSALRSSRLEDCPGELPEGRAWPRVSVIVPACNEGATIEAAARTLLEIDYPNLQLILVDDRSEDGTGEAMDRLAAEHSGVTVVHIRNLPEGWLGKVHAMHVGTQRADGDLLLFTDADVHFQPSVLRHAVTWLETEGLGHLTLLPKIESRSLPYNAMMSSFGLCYFAGMQVWRIGRPGSSAYAGVGAFGLVRRTDFERTKGWEWLKLELGDDVGLGMMMVRQAESQSRFGLATKHLHIRWYDSVGGLIRGLEKNSFGVMCNFKLSRALAAVLLLTALALAPTVALVVPVPWLQALGALVWASVLALAFTFSERVGQSVLGTVLSPFALLVVGVTLLRSAGITLRNGGIAWRGTSYPLDELKAGRRVDV